MSKLQGREQLGTLLGAVHGGTIGTGWTDYTAADFNRMTVASLTTGDKFSSLVIKNRTAANTIYLLARTGGTVAVANAFRLVGAESFAFELYGTNNGLSPTTISLQAVQSPTTIDLTAWFEKA